MTQPRVVICMPTFGRPELLEEAIECFLRQTWTNKLLIIGNDFAEQTLVYEHPQVAVLNRHERFVTLGEKRNWLMAMAGEHFIGHWDDDDLYLPTHIEAVMGLMPQFSRPAAKQHHQWFDNSYDKYRIGFASYMHTVLAHRTVMRAAGDYGALNMNDDSDVLYRMLKKRLLVGPPHALHAPTFIQRLAGRAHMTDFGDACHERMAQDAQAQGRFGLVELNPHWRKDYSEIAEASWDAVQEVVCRA